MQYFMNGGVSFFIRRQSLLNADFLLYRLTRSTVWNVGNAEGVFLAYDLELCDLHSLKCPAPFSQAATATAAAPTSHTNLRTTDLPMAV